MESLDKVRVSRTEVLTQLKDNLRTHKKEYATASEQYRKCAMEELNKKLRQLQGGENISLFTELSPPDDHSKQYERAIKMLEMSKDETLHLDSQQFGCFIQDEWSWRESFHLKNSTYSR